MKKVLMIVGAIGVVAVAYYLIAPEEKRDALLGVLACDPRPGYEDNPDVEYGLAFAEFDIGFRVSGDVLTVTRIELQK